MARQIAGTDGNRWEVALAGRRTQYVRDEIVLEFLKLGDGAGERRYVRFTPAGAKSPERALELASDRLLGRLLAVSQPAWTAPAHSLALNSSR